ncbi:MAG: MFS transporter [Thermofilaceae archaeon]
MRLSHLTQPFRGLDKRYKVILAATGLYNWAASLPATYLQIYTVQLGANPVELGSLSSIGSVASALAAAPAGALMAKHGVRRTLLIGFLVFALSAFTYAIASHWLMLIPASLLSFIAPSLIFPISDIVIVGVTGQGSRATAMGLSRVAWNAFSVLAPPVATAIVVAFGGMTVEGIRPIFLVQLAAALIATFIIAAHMEDLRLPEARSEEGRKSSLWRSLRWLFTKRKALAWFVAMSAQRFGMGVSMAFLPLWIVEVRGADPYVIGAMNTAGIAALLLLSLPAGALSDRYGYLRIYAALRTLLYAGTLLALLVPSREALVAAGGLGIVGLMYGAGFASFIPFITAFWETPPPELRAAWFTASSIIGGLIAAVAPLIGGALWMAGFRDQLLLLALAVDVAGLAVVLLGCR